MASHDASIAGNKFGLGLRPGDARAIASDPRGWLLAQLKYISKTPKPLANLPTSASILESFTEARMDMQQARQAGANRTDKDRQQAFRDSRRMMAQDQQDNTLLRLNTAISTQQPFNERLFQFWANHFTVAASGGPKDIIRQIALPYEQEAIRLNLDKDFASLLLAVEQHPAMLVYLDNTNSFGPGSQVGKRRNRGLNENLAREIMELHTLGVDGGYSQEDVTSLARIITGWTMSDPRLSRTPGSKGNRTTGFIYVPVLHEPGSHRVMKKSYKASGLSQGEAVLRDLATHPATARHIATKLATHFVSDTPSEQSIATLEQVFLETRGDLPSLHAALVDLDEAWETDKRKLKTPQDLVVSTARALDLSPVIASEEGVATMFSRILATFNQMPWTAISPAGWEDSASYWGGPDALMKRTEWANTVANLNPHNRAARDLASDILPENTPLDLALARAESPHQAMTLLLASPAFQWRGV